MRSTKKNLTDTSATHPHRGADFEVKSGRRSHTSSLILRFQPLDAVDRRGGTKRAVCFSRWVCFIPIPEHHAAASEILEDPVSGLVHRRECPDAVWSGVGVAGFCPWF